MSNHLELDMRNVDVLTEQITLPLLWRCKPTDLVVTHEIIFSYLLLIFMICQAIVTHFWPAISASLSIASKPNLGLSFGSSQDLSNRTIGLTLILGIVETLFTRVPIDVICLNYPS